MGEILILDKGYEVKKDDVVGILYHNGFWLAPKEFGVGLIETDHTAGLITFDTVEERLEWIEENIPVGARKRVTIEEFRKLKQDKIMGGTLTIDDFDHLDLNDWE